MLDYPPSRVNQTTQHLDHLSNFPRHSFFFHHLSVLSQHPSFFRGIVATAYLERTLSNRGFGLTPFTIQRRLPQRLSSDYHSLSRFLRVPTDCDLILRACGFAFQPVNLQQRFFVGLFELISNQYRSLGTFTDFESQV